MARGNGNPAERVPWQQVLLDDVFLLLLLGVAVPVLLYIIWGLMELANLPVMG